MLDATTFLKCADATLNGLFDRLDAAYEAGGLEELELEGLVLTIITETGKTFIVSAHAPSTEIWLASPLSGGLHFRHQDDDWVLPSGERLADVLARDLATQGVEMTA
jgi:iron donor protein CyaY